MFRGANLEYLPYGETWVHNKASETGYTTPYKFTGKELDPETGLYYYGARYYDPVLSRWVSADDRFDGLYSTQGQDIYGYVRGNPVQYVDPTGHESVRSGLWAAGDWLHEKFGSGSSYWVKDSDKGTGSSGEQQAKQQQEGKAKTPRVELAGGKVTENLNKALNQFAEETNTTITASAGKRSSTRNRPETAEYEADSRTSQHFIGNAFDFIQFDSDGNRLTKEQSADLAFQSGLFNAIEYSSVSDFVHVDLRSTHSAGSPLLFEQVSKNPYEYTYGNDSTFWKNYTPGKYMKYPAKPPGPP